MALQRQGCEVEFSGYREFVGRWSTVLRMLISRSSVAKRISFPIVLTRYNEAVKRTASKFEPDLVLAIKGEAVAPDTVDWFSDQLGSTTALWYPDDPRYFHTLGKLLAPRFDYVFTAAEGFIPIYEDVGARNVSLLPFACEPTVHRKTSLTAQESRNLASDVCFVGTFSRRRRKLIRRLAKMGIRLRVWGPYWNWFEPALSQGTAFGPQLTKIFNCARIALNIHDESDVTCKPNMRLFEATGCGAFHICDRVFSIQKYFEPGREVICYDDERELIDLVGKYLRTPNDRDIVSKNAYEKAHQEHTYDLRASALLKVVL
jgi:spore maturation protein CgeB